MKLRPLLYGVLLVAIAARASDSGPMPLHAGGLENVFRVADAIYSGSSPESPSAFESLRGLGIKTIISVDGAKPDVATARKTGMRYVHIPVGYDAISREQALKLAKALRAYPGPFYIHCHHGKHRGPAAAAIALMCADASCPVERAVNVMTAAGTDPKYKGLFRSVETFARPRDSDLAQLPGTLPEVAETDSLTEAMVSIDRHWENLKAAKAAGWKTPPDHPDVAPAHEALQLREAYREIDRMPQGKLESETFRQLLRDAERTAAALEMALRDEPANRDEAFRSAGELCARCHAAHRDNR